jgi:hypothetical protein
MFGFFCDVCLVNPDQVLILQPDAWPFGCLIVIIGVNNDHNK